MAYSLQDFCFDVRQILGYRDDSAGRDQVRARLEILLADPDFRAKHIGSKASIGMTEIHKDEQMGFCVLAYNMDASRQSPPHDHGRSWAVYGQAEGHTDVTLWKEGSGKIRADRTFRLNAGEAGLFDVQEIHSIEYVAGAKFVRVTGIDMSTEPRRVFDPKTGSVKEIESVGTGSRPA